MDCSMPGLPVYNQLPEFTQTHVHWIGDAIQPSHLLNPSLPAINLSQHQGLSNESALHIRWPKYWSFSVNISSSNEYSGLISFRMDWLDLLAVQGTLTSLLHYHSSKASVLWCSTFFVVQLSQCAQTHVHWVSDVILSSHSLSSPSPPTFNLSQHQDLFKWVSSLHQVAKVLEFQLQHQSFQWIFRTDFL